MSRGGAVLLVGLISCERKLVLEGRLGAFLGEIELVDARDGGCGFVVGA